MTFKRIMALIGGLSLSIVLIACPSSNDARPGNDNDNDDDPIVEPSELDPVNIGGIDFASVGTFTGAEIAAIQAQIDTLTPEQLAEFADYVSSWTLTRDTERSISLTGEEGEEMAEIRGIVGGNILADLAAGREDAQDARDVGTDPVINFVQERTSEDGNTIRFYAEEGVDTEALIASIMSMPEAVFNARSEGVSRAVQLLEVEGGRHIEIGEDGRAILYRDGTAGTLNQDLQAAQLYAQAQQAAALQ